MTRKEQHSMQHGIAKTAIKEHKNVRYNLILKLLAVPRIGSMKVGEVTDIAEQYLAWIEQPDKKQKKQLDAIETKLFGEPITFV